MFSQEVVLINRSGLHARPASDFVQEAKKFKSKITITNAEQRNVSGNGKSIIAILSMGLSAGTKILIEANGEDENEAVAALVSLVDSGFNEE